MSGRPDGQRDKGIPLFSRSVAHPLIYIFLRQRTSSVQPSDSRRLSDWGLLSLLPLFSPSQKTYRKRRSQREQSISSRTGLTSVYHFSFRLCHCHSPLLLWSFSFLPSFIYPFFTFTLLFSISKKKNRTTKKKGMNLSSSLLSSSQPQSKNEGEKARRRCKNCSQLPQQTRSKKSKKGGQLSDEKRRARVNLIFL